MTPSLRPGLIAAVLTVALDQASKLWLIYGYELGGRGIVKVLPFFDLVLAWNTGISYGWFQTDSTLGQAVLLTIKITAVVALAIWMARSNHSTTVALSVMLL